MLTKSVKIYVSGHTGLVGSSVVRRLQCDGATNLVLRNRHEVDLTDGVAVRDFFQASAPELVISCAAKVGGVQDRLDHPADFLYENLQIQNNLIWGAKETGVRKFLFLGSSSVYPSDCPQPMKEEVAMEGNLGYGSDPYAYAKTMGLKLCDYVSRQYGLDFFTCLAANIYGERDNFDPASAHVIPALIHRFHTAMLQSAPEVTVWGNAYTTREFIHVDDVADALVWLLEKHSGAGAINLGTGTEVSIGELAETLKSIVGYRGRIVFDQSRPAGRPRRLLDVTKLSATGWLPRINLEDGLKRVYSWYLSQLSSGAMQN